MFFEQRLLYCTKISKNEKTFKNEHRSRDVLPKNELIQVEYGKVIIVRISMYLLTTPTNHTYTF